MGLFTLHRQKQPAFSWQPERPEPESGIERPFPENSYYLLPRSTAEVGRLDFQHYLLRSVLHSDYAAPLPEETYEILDVGCGTGLWCRAMARQFPQAFLTGVDLQPPPQRPDDSPRCQFVTGNVLKGLPFDAGSFDYVHQRLLGTSIPAHAWPLVVRELARVSRRGGWIELLETSGRVVNAGPLTQRVLGWWSFLCQKSEIEPGVVEHLGALLGAAGLSAILERTLRVPLGNWERRTGTLLATSVLAGLRALQPRLCRMLGIAPALYEETLAGLPQEWERGRCELCFYLACGRV